MISARKFFDRVLSASDDAASCQRQLKLMESGTLSLGGSGFEPRVRSTPDPHRQQNRSNAYMDRERSLQSRMDEDYRIIDLGSLVLYGDADGRRGLDHEQSPKMADILWWRYLGGVTWDRVARAVNMSVRPCQIMHNQAFAWMDETGFMADVMDSIDL